MKGGLDMDGDRSSALFAFGTSVLVAACFAASVMDKPVVPSKEDVPVVDLSIDGGRVYRNCHNVFSAGPSDVLFTDSGGVVQVLHDVVWHVLPPEDKGAFWHKAKGRVLHR